MNRLNNLSLILAIVFSGTNAVAQIPVEVFAGHKKTTFDVMFFRFIKNQNAENSRFLFFNRNRFSIDYHITRSNFLPQFGCTEALSYNHKNWKGFAPVLVASVLNNGIYPKAGIQFARSSKNYVLFTWLVAEIMNRPDIDFFVLSRYSPSLNKKLNLFSQLELVNVFPSATANNFSFIQRLRLGIKKGPAQLGAGADFTAVGRRKYTATRNIGVFLRHEF